MDPNSDAENIQDEDLRNRASEIIALGKAGDKEAIPRLVGILENKTEVEWLRGCAAIALGRISGEEVVPPLLRALRDESPFVNRAAILASGDLKIKSAIPYLEAIFRDPNKKELHAVTVNVLAQIGGSSVISNLLEALKSPDVRVRCNAAMALGSLRAPSSVLPLIELIHDSDESLRAVAASSLGLIKDQRAVEILIEALQDKAETVRAIAASSLGYMEDKKAVPFLEKALQDRNLNVRKQAANALSKLKSEEK
jgi:HEAT repeat protein